MKTMHRLKIEKKKKAVNNGQALNKALESKTMTKNNKKLRNQLSKHSWFHPESGQTRMDQMFVSLRGRDAPSHSLFTSNRNKKNTERRQKNNNNNKPGSLSTSDGSFYSERTYCT